MVCFWATHEACSIWYSNLFPPLNLILGYDKFSHYDYGLVKVPFFSHFLGRLSFSLERNLCCLMQRVLNSTSCDMGIPYNAFFWLAFAWGIFVRPLMLMFIISVLSEYFVTGVSSDLCVWVYTTICVCVCLILGSLSLLKKFNIHSHNVTMKCLAFLPFYFMFWVHYSFSIFSFFLFLNFVGLTKYFIICSLLLLWWSGSRSHIHIISAYL